MIDRFAYIISYVKYGQLFLGGLLGRGALEQHGDL